MQSFTPDEIRASFVNCSKGEAKRLSLPTAYDAIRWPDLDFLGWRSPSGTGTAYVVAPFRGELTGLVLRVGNRAGHGGRSNMCAFCLTTHSTSDMDLMVAPRAGAAGRNGNTVGTYLCADLACSLYVRRLRKPSRVQPVETTTTEARVARLQENLDTFVRQVTAPVS